MYNYKTEPFKHQRQALREGAKDYNFAYFMEMGTGKTKVAIDVLKSSNTKWLNEYMSK